MSKSRAFIAGPTGIPMRSFADSVSRHGDCHRQKIHCGTGKRAETRLSRCEFSGIEARLIR
jgi:hypothetical protein